MIKDDRGSALVLALISLAMLVVLSTGLVTITNNEWRSSKLGVRDLEYKYLAESGIERALAELRRDMLWTPDLNEIYEVDGNRGYRFDQWDWDDGKKVFKIKSTAMVAGQPHTSIYVELKPEALPDAFNYAACAGEKFEAETLIGSGLFAQGGIHANQEIYWWVTLPLLPMFPPTLSTTPTGKITFDWPFRWLLGDLRYKKVSRPPVLIPTVNWEYYKEFAQDLGTYKKPEKGGDLRLGIGGSERLVFVDGDVIIIGLELERCLLVATGHVYLANVDVLDLIGSGKLTILAGGDINFLADLNLLFLSKTRGIYYAGRDINVPVGLELANGMEGTLVAGRNINFLLGVNIRHDDSVNNPPPHVYWTSTEPPQIIKWEEKKA